MGNGITLKLQGNTLYGREKSENTTLDSNFASTELHKLKTLSKQRTLQNTKHKTTLLKKSNIKIVKKSNTITNTKLAKRKKIVVQRKTERVINEVKKTLFSNPFQELLIPLIAVV